MKKVLFLAIVCMALLGCERGGNIKPEDMYGTLYISNSSDEDALYKIYPITQTVQLVDSKIYAGAGGDDRFYATHELLLGTYDVIFYSKSMSKSIMISIETKGPYYLDFPTMEFK
jgi:hypothetical protein